VKRLAVTLACIAGLSACSTDSTLTYPAPCYRTVEAAHAVGDTEDSVCATWITSKGNTVTGPAWAMEQSDVEVRP
jgi:uncharacterized protein YceK